MSLWKPILGRFGCREGFRSAGAFLKYSSIALSFTCVSQSPECLQAEECLTGNVGYLSAFFGRGRLMMTHHPIERGTP